MLAAEASTLTERDYYARYLGFDDVGVFERWRSGIDERRIDDLVEQKAVRLEALERDISILFPGAAAAMRRLAAAVPLAIASGAIGVEIRRVLEREDLGAFFAAIVAAEDTPTTSRRRIPICARLQGSARRAAVSSLRGSAWPSKIPTGDSNPPVQPG